MGELTDSAYQSLIKFACSGLTTGNQWGYIELYDENKSQVTRVSVTNDSRFSWTDLDGDETFAVDGTIAGSDTDIPQGTTIEYVALWDASSGGNQLTKKEHLTPQTFSRDKDTMDITLTLKIPNR